MFTLVLMMMVTGLTNPQTAMTSVPGFTSRTACELAGSEFEQEYSKRYFHAQSKNPDFFANDTVGVVIDYKTYFSHKCIEVR